MRQPAEQLQRRPAVFYVHPVPACGTAPACSPRARLVGSRCARSARCMGLRASQQFDPAARFPQARRLGPTHGLEPGIPVHAGGRQSPTHKYRQDCPIPDRALCPRRTCPTSPAPLHAHVIRAWFSPSPQRCRPQPALDHDPYAGGIGHSDGGRRGAPSRIPRRWWRSSDGLREPVGCSRSGTTPSCGRGKPPPSSTA